MPAEVHRVVRLGELVADNSQVNTVAGTIEQSHRLRIICDQPADSLVPDKWLSFYHDHQAGTPGRLLVNFWHQDGKHGAWAVYKTPQIPKSQP